jgi:hypothetical protein
MMKKEHYLPSKHIELSPWKTPLGIGHANGKETDLPAYRDEAEEEYNKKQNSKRRLK